MSEDRYDSQRPIRSLYYLLGARPAWYLGTFLILVLKSSPMQLAPVTLAIFVHVLSAPEPNMLYLWLWFAFYGLLWLQNIPSHMWFVRCVSKQLRSAECRLRARLVERIQQLSINYFSEKQTGALQSKILRDVENIEQTCLILIQHGYHFSLSLAILVVLLAIQAPILLLFMGGMLPLCALLVRTFKRRVQCRNKAFRTYLEGMNSSVHEMVNMISVTRAHGLEETEIERVQSRLGEVRKHGVRLDTINALFMASSTVTVFMTQGTALMILGWLCFHGHLTVAEVVLYQGLFMSVIMSTMQLLSMYPNIEKGLESVRSLGDVLECPSIEHNQGTHEFAQLHGDIRFENVGFRYPTKESSAVEGISFETKAGQCTALVGASGSGKSTLMNLLIGFWMPREGRVEVDGHSMETINLRRYRQQLAVVPQHTVLLSGTLLENITYGLEHVEEAKLREAIEAANLAKLVEDLPEGLQTQVGENGLQLSGGQRQRIAIARALVRDPRIIILDEATSALDVESERLVQQAINRLIAGRTTFIVAHRLSTIRHADQILVLKEGCLVESGSPEDLSEGDTHFSRMRALQV